jgi:DNA primase
MDVKQLLDEKHLNYISKGRDYKVRCLNPEHEDTHPSMNIDKITGIFHCYSCGFAGDIFEYFNINKEKFINIKIQKVREKIKSLLGNKSLPIPLDAVYFNDEFRGISKSTLRKFGAFTTDSIPGMEGRLVFPISNISKDIIAFQGRYLYSDLDPKYKIYPEHVTLPLYPSIVIPKNDSIILVEGMLDMINLHDKGLTNTVCTFGTAFGSVKKKHKQKANLEKLLPFKYQGVTTLYIMYDGDKAGYSAAESLQEFTKDSFNSQIIYMNKNKDPGSLNKKEVASIREEYYG